ncbi:MAG: hypothetical protein JWO86_8079 [Myxococcaceae bacterium]|nr:hypothetical protein [Myxococcaceae bacterium]MEA2751161.1 hypothetical protein [Myxococcales bacterium]
MNGLASVEAFSITISDAPSAVHVCLVGDANMNAVDELGQALGVVHGRALAAGATEVVVDLRQLEFMNSACFKKIVTWITRVEEVEASARYRIRFLSNATIHWQRRSLHALQMFAIDLVAVDV